MNLLLERREFRNAVFDRDNNQCVMCYAPAQDAHHIMERRLWPDGGYYLDNGASLCGPCHLKAESTEYSTAQIRLAAGIKTVVLPPHLYRDQRYDKWGNIELPNGNRLVGELFYDESVQKIIKPYLDDFKPYIKYPRTYHLPDSPGKTKDDRALENLDCFAGERVIITEKMDGENTTIYNDYIHARSIDGRHHPSRDWVKNLAAKIAHWIPDGYRVCGENLWAKHSIEYNELEDYFLGFSVWDHHNECVDWDNTLWIFEAMGIKHVPVVYDGTFDLEVLKNFQQLYSEVQDKHEGFVIRLADQFSYADFRKSVAKWVRPNHVQSSHNWMRQEITRNKTK